MSTLPHRIMRLIRDDVNAISCKADHEIWEHCTLSTIGGGIGLATLREESRLSYDRGPRSTTILINTIDYIACQVLILEES